MVVQSGCDSPGDTCSVNLGWILFKAGDLVGAYRHVEPLAQRGDQAAVAQMIEICERGGDIARSQYWRARLRS